MKANLKLPRVALLSICLAFLVFTSVGAEEDEPIRVTGVELDKTEATLVLGKKLELNALVFPRDADDRRVEWSSSDPLVAEVETSEHSAMVVSRSQGEAVITVTTVDQGYSADFNLKVVVLVRSIGIQPQEIILAPGEEAELEASIIPRDATVQGVLWESSNPGIASVNQEGMIEALQEGETRIIVRSLENDQVYAYCSLQVTIDVTPIIEAEEPVDTPSLVEVEDTFLPDSDTNFVLYFLIGVAVIILLAVAAHLIFKRRKALPSQNIARPAPGAGIQHGTGPVLVGLSGIYAGQRIRIDHDQITIGRDPSVAQVLYPPENTDISRKHCTVYYDSQLQQFSLEDSSSNGTFLANGEKIEENKLVNLRPGESFFLSEDGEAFTVELE